MARQKALSWKWILLVATGLGAFSTFMAGQLYTDMEGASWTHLSILNFGLPSQFLHMVPYVVTIIVVAGLVGRVRAPAADGRPYKKE